MRERLNMSEVRGRGRGTSRVPTEQGALPRAGSQDPEIITQDPGRTQSLFSLATEWPGREMVWLCLLWPEGIVG